MKKMYVLPQDSRALMTKAGQIMKRYNPNACIAIEGDRVIMIEDISANEEKTMFYRLEYRSNPQGTEAEAFLLYNPFGDNPFSFEESHLRNDGWLCLAKGNKWPLEFVIQRARFWCHCYTYLRQHGLEALRRIVPEWG